jgi:hypothetical protein
MKIQEVQDLFLRKVEIVPFEGVEGTITTLTYGIGGLQLNVRYYLDGQQKEDWFFTEELIIKDDNL